MRITRQMLEDLGACEEQVERFDFVFPDGAELTREAARLALEAELEVDWLVEHNEVPRRVVKRIVRCCAQAHPNGWLPLVGLAQRSDVSRVRLWMLSMHPAHFVRYEVATNDRTPVFVLRRLARDPVPAVRRGTTFNGRTPTEVVWGLTMDPDPEVSKPAHEELELRGLA